jgi:hypothetical protein
MSAGERILCGVPKFWLTLQQPTPATYHGVLDGSTGNALSAYSRHTN